MSRFFVGQRVRIVSAQSVAGRILVGTETTIRRIGIRKGEFMGMRADGACWVMKFDSDCELECASKAHPGARAVMMFYQLEPITDSNEVVSWESCAWKPSHLEVDA